MNYFDGCKTRKEARTKMRQDSLKLHPDKGGNKEEFQEMRRQYEEFGINIKIQLSIRRKLQSTRSKKQNSR